jgi:hypothetical protein
LRHLQRAECEGAFVEDAADARIQARVQQGKADQE